MNKQNICTRTFYIVELKEETIRKRLQALLELADPELSIQNSAQYITLRLCTQAPTRAEGEGLLDRAEQRIRALLTNYVLSAEEASLQKIIGTYLDKGPLTVSTMESLTGGLIASALTDVHESAAHFIGGIVSYSTPLKERMGVPHETIEQYGVVSEETARAMAQAVRKFLDTDIGLGITGIAGPDKQEDKPVGTVYIAIDGPYGMLTGTGSERCAGPEREENKQAAAISALNLLRRYLERRASPASQD
ncbi:nicotinamide-nucleotide amidohydrolase family protein [Ktedonosporobacter rubrisoli]|uniref:Nicotinamide-nucleotide amidohydrolase family protein n=1 Tax=Ktedonosporobacter rubrisoli TaxID=2509675 RepID=A0A4P6JP99_KTERU|nr:nicotinamide-nucleotide amidohydrolase family protein [Ktedonosporobacter rubrisoli]QBD76586.1 nicotinamide-nucleotide amidohydrolase family protein [Ktedonosporobacter rubrisoli]